MNHYYKLLLFICCSGVCFLKELCKVLAALLLKHHCETPDSKIYENLRSQIGEMSVASICTGTGSYFGKRRVASCMILSECL